MSATRSGEPSTEARTAFARLLERRERGEPVDFAAEIEAAGALAPDLRTLHAGWRRLQHLFDGLDGQESALRSVARGSRAEIDPEAAALLEALADPERGARRYERLELRARGAMGEVWRVHDRDLDREVAMKILRARWEPGVPSRAAGLVRRFLAEARLLARLEHPGILPLFDLGLDGAGRVWFTLPLVRGETLAELLARGGAPLTGVLEILLRACDAVQYAHARGVLHRDLKPSNMLVGEFGAAYVVDWGLARLRRDAPPGADRAPPDRDPSGAADDAFGTRHGDVVGTPAYMAPEQAAGRLADVGPRADVYALGAILYHALCGRAPYDEAREAGTDVVAAVRAGPPEALAVRAPDAAPELVAVADKAMARDPRDRYADVGALAADLRAFLAGRVVRAHRSGAWPELVAWVRRNRALAGALLAAFVLAFAGLAAWSVQRERAAREVLRLSDVARLSDLLRRAEALGEPVSERRAEFERWLEDAAQLVARRDVHAASLAQLEARASRSDPLDGTSDEDRWRRAVLEELVRGLDRLADPDPRPGGIAGVRARLERARDLERASLVDAAPAWRAARDAVAASATYRGLDLAPQSGLVPLGADPDSGLQEFAHLASGAPAARGADGRLALKPESGVVLVLIPAGSFRMGASRAGWPDEPGSDPWAAIEEGPTRTVRLAPFLAAKHEITVAQWERLAAASPAWHARTAPGAAAGLLPVESVTWDEARTVLGRAGLALPTEAQWECAARGGTAWRWWCGPEPGSLRGAVHGQGTLDPRSARESAPVRVDDLRANGFGLFHVLGNVAEWTLDPWSDEATTGLRADDGLRLAGESDQHALRGGHYQSGAGDLRCTARERVPAQWRDRRVGVRAVRALDP